MIEKTDTLRDRLNKAAVRAAARIYVDRNISRWGLMTVKPEQICAVWRMAYKRLADSHPNNKFLQVIATKDVKKIDLRRIITIDGETFSDRKAVSKLECIYLKMGRGIILELLGIMNGLGENN